MATSSGWRTGMRGFILVWLGQIVSLLGSGMTNFGLQIWAFEQTGRATDLALLGVFYSVPLLILSPLTGVIVDRYNRKLLMVLSDCGSGLVSIVVFVLLSNDTLAMWHLFVSAAALGTFQSVQWPAYSAAVTLMLPKEQYTRANSLLELAGPSSQIFAPLAAGALLGVIGLPGILTIDIVTFVFAVSALLLVSVPQPSSDETAPHEQAGMVQELLFGFRYLLKRRELLALQSVFMVNNFVHMLAFTLFVPMVLARTGNDEVLLGSVQTIGAVGGLLGGIAITIWGGFKRRINGVLIGWAVAQVCIAIIGLGRPAQGWAGLILWGAGMFVASMFAALINSSNQAIWQTKVPPEVQGRVFSIRRLVAWLVMPLASLVAGPLADQVMEPAMLQGGALAGQLGWLVGVGPGAGMAVILVASGLLGVATSMVWYLSPLVRDVEDRLPDFDATVPEHPQVAA